MYAIPPHWPARILALAALAAAAPFTMAQAPATTPGAAASQPPAPPPAPPPASPEESAYSIGLVFGTQLHTAGFDQSLPLDAVMRGLKDGLGGKTVSDEDKARAMQLVRSGREKVAERNHAAAREFLAQNAKAPGVTTTDSGLQYQIIMAGDAKAASPTASDRVTVHYRGRLLDGSEFDNSDNHAQVPTFSVGTVIKGWREALLLMKPGAKWRLFIPPELAYDMNSPGAIPPGSLLIFDVELLKIEPPQVMKPPAAKSPKAAKPASTPAAKPAVKQ
jgi:FKBP-type peptidyl-prolyl cis-trans isomerase